jgi:hypothetical protein
MKKILYILAIFFTLSILSANLFAKTETEYDKAIRYYNTGKYREAVEIFKDYIKTKPDAPAYYRIGYALYEIGEYDEANKYFQQAYLIDPSFSPNIVAPRIKAERIAKPSIQQAPSVKEPQVPAVIETRPETPPAAVREPQPQMQMEPHKPQEQVTAPIQEATPGQPQAVPPGEEATPQESQVVTPRRVQPPAGFPKFPEPTKGMPTGLPGMPSGLGTLIAGLGMLMTVIQIVSILLYLFFCYCLFRIAKKLEVPSPWLAFIPIVQIWTIVSCAGKPWWWILLLFIPLLNIIIGILLWMYIAENMGRNKWLGLLMLVPIVNYIFLAMLAFSKTEQVGPAEGISTV